MMASFPARSAAAAAAIASFLLPEVDATPVLIVRIVTRAARPLLYPLLRVTLTPPRHKEQRPQHARFIPNSRLLSSDFASNPSWRIVLEPRQVSYAGPSSTHMVETPA